MARTTQFLIANICFKIQGDVGPLSTYTKGRKITVFPKAWLRDPASPMQIAHRNRIRAVAQNWKAEPQLVRANWEKISKTLSLYINGYNLYMSMSMNLEARDALPTLTRQSRINVSIPAQE